MLTLVLTRTEVERLLEPDALLRRIREGFVAAQGQRAPHKVRSSLPQSGASATVLLPGTLPDIPAYTVKVHAKFPNQDPAIRGVVHLFDRDTGGLLAVMDAGYLTALRTAAAAAVATHTLAKQGGSSLALIGAGAQNSLLVRLLARLRPLHTVTVFDTAPMKTGRFVKALASETQARLVPTDSLVEAVADADMIVAATWSRDPFLYPELLKSGAHVTTLGADEPGKVEVSAELLLASRVFCDDRALVLELGAVGNVGLGDAAITADLGEVLAGRSKGRLEGELSVYAGVGSAWMDAAAAWLVYERATEREVGQRIDFLA